jgi:pimeloyl-ACP methyl ester carboxylesterase
VSSHRHYTSDERALTTVPRPRLRRVIRGAGLTAALLGLASRLYQSEAEARDARWYPPPGRMVDIGGRRLHVWLEGAGSPSVVVVPCLGGTGASWTPVMRSLAATTTVCLVDRAGIGWSDAGPWPRTGTAIAEELHQLLVLAGVPQPYILVGHSTGGLISRVFAARHSEELAGMVLVDATPPDTEKRIFRSPRWKTDFSVIRSLLMPAGFYRAAHTLGLVDGPRAYNQRFLPAEEVEGATACSLARRRRGGAQEMLELPSLRAQVEAEAHQLGSLPLAVLVGGPVHREEWHDTWLELQREYLTLSSESTFTYAAHTGHHVHNDDPELTARVILELLSRVDAGRLP